MNTEIEITIAGKTYSAEFCGVKEGEMVKIERNQFGANRVVKSSDGVHWIPVDHPENYGFPSVQISRINH